MGQKNTKILFNTLIWYQIGVKSVLKWNLFYQIITKECLFFPLADEMALKDTINVHHTWEIVQIIISVHDFSRLLCPTCLLLSNYKIFWILSRQIHFWKCCSFRWGVLVLLFEYCGCHYEWLALVLIREGLNKVYDPQSEVFEPTSLTSETITLPKAWMSHFNENEDSRQAKLKLNIKPFWPSNFSTRTHSHERETEQQKKKKRKTPYKKWPKCSWISEWVKWSEHITFFIGLQNVVLVWWPSLSLLLQNLI